MQNYDANDSAMSDKIPDNSIEILMMQISSLPTLIKNNWGSIKASYKVLIKSNMHSIKFLPSTNNLLIEFDEDSKIFIIFYK